MTPAQKFFYSDQWAALSYETKALYGFKCAQCRQRSWNLKVYYVQTPRNLKSTTLEDLISLCPTCHKASQWF